MNGKAQWGVDLRAAGALMLAMAVAGCAGPGAAPETRSPEEVVLALAIERWENLIAGRYNEAWQALSPGAKDVRPMEGYASELAARPVKWTSVAPVGSTCEPDPPRCTVTVRIGYKLRSHLTGVGMVAGESEQSEAWIQIDGSWVHVPETVLGG